MAAPTIPAWGPTTGQEAPDVNVTFTCDDDNNVDETTLDLLLKGPDDLVYVYALQNGIWQAGYNGTIIPASKGFIVTLTTHTPFVVGAWLARAYCEDFDPLSVQKDWGFGVQADAPVVSGQHPADGSVTTVFDGIRFVLTDDWGIDLSTFVVKLKNSRSERFTIYDGGAGGWQTGYDGIYTASGGADPTEIQIDVKTYPAMESPMLWTVEVDADSIVGKSL